MPVARRKIQDVAGIQSSHGPAFTRNYIKTSERRYE
jgi:hypothetical protein